MKKILSWAIKIIPIITIWQGLTSGGARLHPFFDTAKVALTQYEVAQITKLVFDDFNRQGQVVSPKVFSEFVRDNYHSQYSVLAREIVGDKKHDHAFDIWGHAFQLLINEDVTDIKVASAGPDGIILNKDDVAANFMIDRPKPKLAKQNSQGRSIASENVDTESLGPQEVTEYEENVAAENENRAPAADAYQYDEEGFDTYGFDKNGYDRDGYDQNGMHRNEKEIATTDARNFE